MRFVDVKNDVAFRKIFGNEKKKEILISFLNAALQLEDDHKIVSVEILSPYLLPDLSGGKASVLDLKAIDQNKKTYLIEMQVGHMSGSNLSKRVLFYASKSYASQISQGGEYMMLNPVFFIGILDFEATEDTKYLNRHRVLNVETGEHFVKDIEFIFIELPKFKKPDNELTSIIDQWIYFLKNAGDIKIVPENITDEGLKSAYWDAERFNWSQAELESYDYASMREQDVRAKKDFAVEQKEKEMRELMEKKLKQKEKEKIMALKQKEKEMTAAMKREKEELTLKLLDMGLSFENISKATGLTEKEIEKLKNNRKN